jgi:hypothetical protein
VGEGLGEGLEGGLRRGLIEIVSGSPGWKRTQRLAREDLVGFSVNRVSRVDSFGVIT